MATLEMITLYGDPELWLYLSFAVGRPGVNQKGPQGGKIQILAPE